MALTPHYHTGQPQGAAAVWRRARGAHRRRRLRGGAAAEQDRGQERVPDQRARRCAGTQCVMVYTPCSTAAASSLCFTAAVGSLCSAAAVGCCLPLVAVCRRLPVQSSNPTRTHKPPWQALPLGGLSVVAPTAAPTDGSLFAASSAAPGSVWRLRPVPLETQARTLAAAHDFPGE